MLDTIDIVLTIALCLLFWKVVVLEREVDSNSSKIRTIAKMLWKIIEGIEKPGGIHR